MPSPSYVMLTPQGSLGPCTLRSSRFPGSTTFFKYMTILLQTFEVSLTQLKSYVHIVFHYHILINIITKYSISLKAPVTDNTNGIQCYFNEGKRSDSVTIKISCKSSF